MVLQKRIIGVGLVLFRKWPKRRLLLSSQQTFVSRRGIRVIGALTDLPTPISDPYLRERIRSARLTSLRSRVCNGRWAVGVTIRTQSFVLTKTDI